MPVNGSSGLPAPALHEIAREGLLELLRANRSCSVVVLLAPAGFGKSTLAAAYARASGASVCWVTLHAAHRDPSFLFAQLASELETVFGQGHLLPELRRGLAAGAEGVALARMLAADLRHVESSFILVLDDFHLVNGAADSEQAVDLLIRHLPPGGQILITAREPPLLPATELLSDDRIFVIGADELRFTPDETRRLRLLLGGDASGDSAAEGWVAGILLGGAPRHLGIAGGRLLGAYIEREILGRLRNTERSWLETLCVLDTITPGDAARLLGQAPWAHRLASIAERCPFLVRAESSDYRLHALVRDYLLERLGRSGPRRTTRVWSIARDLAAQHHDTAGMVRACQELGALDEAVALVVRVADEALRVGRWPIALDTLRLLPSAVRSADADLLLAEAHALVQLGQPEPARESALAALELGGRSARPLVQISALIELANIARYCGDCTTAEEWLSSADYLLVHAEIPKEPRRAREGRALGLRGVCLAVRGQMHEAREALESAERVLGAESDTRELAVVLYNLGLLYVRSGDFGLAQQALANATARWRVLGDHALLAATQILLGSLQLRLGQLEAAGATLTSALDAARATGALRLETHVLASIGAWHRANGRLAEATTYLDDSLRLAEELREREPLVEALRLRGELALIQNDLPKARDLLRRAQAEGQLLESSFQMTGVGRALGRLHLAQGATERAVQHLQAACDRAEQSSGIDELIVTLYWLGTAYLLSGEARLAEDALARALSLAAGIGGLAIVAGPAAEDLRLLRHSMRLGHNLVALSTVAKIAATRQPWSEAPSPIEHIDPTGELPRVEVQLFETFVVHVDGELVDVGARGAGRAHELLALLVLHPDGLPGREIADLLWSDMPPRKALHNLQMTVYLLRRLLCGKLALPHVHSRYRLDPGLIVWADIRLFTDSLARAKTASDEEARQLIEQAIELYRGPLLASTDWEWTHPFRERYRRQLLNALLRLADICKTDDAAASARHLEHALTLEPDNEDAFERLLDLARRRGDASAEVHLRRRYEEVVAELGLAPNPRLATRPSMARLGK